MARKGANPEPRKVVNKGTWEIYWYWNRKKYSYRPGLYPEQEDRANYFLHVIAAELHKDEPEFHDDMLTAPGIASYLSDRYGTLDMDDLRKGWLEAYETTLGASVGKGWMAHSKRYLAKLAAFTGDIQKVTPNQAQEYLSNLVHSGLSPATHNKALAACSRFFKWAVRTKRTRKNPFEGIKQLREAVTHDIVFCTKDDRRKIIKLASESGWPDWLAVPIAFYAGMRREEICRMRWRDVDFQHGIIKIGKTKTGRSRETPLNKHLESMLKRNKGEDGDYVVAMDHRKGSKSIEERRADRMTAFVIHLRRDMEQQDGKFPLERIGWNSFRHTFASLLVQSGVDIDTVSSWMGNTPEVCRRHYAQFIPRDRRDERINRI